MERHWTTVIPLSVTTYHAIPHAPLGFSDHSMIYLLPSSYRQRLKKEKSKTCTVKCGDTDCIETLRGCMECNDQDSFRPVCADIHEYTDVVTSYIHFCEELCVPTKTMKKFPNDKPWISGDLREKVKKKEEAHRSGDCVLYKKAKYEVHQAVRGAKVKYRCKLESQILSNNSHAVWQGLQTITGFKKKNADRPNASPSLPDELNHFYSRFDKLNTTPVTAQPPDVSMPLPPPFVVEEGGVGWGSCS